MQLSAELRDNKIIVEKTRDAGLLHSKSRFGTPLPGNRLQLDLLEAVFLVGENKLKVFHKKKELDFQNLVQSALNEYPHFELRYLVFRDLRKRGYAVKQVQDKKNISFSIQTPKTQKPFREKPQHICVFSERDTITIDTIKTIIQTSGQKNNSVWIIIVDEEGDITYYDVSFIELKGQTSRHVFPKGSGILLDNRVVVFDTTLSTLLKEKEFFGKPFGEGLQLSLVEAVYLAEYGVLEISKSDEPAKLPREKVRTIVQQQQPDITTRLFVFTDLKQRGLIVKTGFKFGTHFRAYTKDPEETHAEYLVHVVEKGFSSIWAEISRGVRLAHSVNKDFVFARVDGEHIEYIRFGRLRP